MPATQGIEISLSESSDFEAKKSAADEPTPQSTLQNDQNQPQQDDSSSQPNLKDQAVAKRRAQITRQALSCRGSRYVWGGDGRGGVFDCSGFTRFLYAKRGIKLPHSAKAQYNSGTPVNRDELKEGDLVFFNTRGPLTHVGMCIGDGQFIHAANRRRGVVVDSLDEPYYVRKYAGARRYTKSVNDEE